MTADENYQLLEEIEANRLFLLMAYQQNPKLLMHADERIRQLLVRLDERGDLAGSEPEARASKS